MTAPLDLAALRALVDALNLVHVSCDNVHHAKRDQNHGDECPVVVRVNAARAQLPALLDELEAMRQGEDAVRAFVAWLDAEDGKPDYGTQTRETHPEGVRIWREWFDRNIQLCGDAQDKGHAFLAALDRARGEGRTDA